MAEKKPRAATAPPTTRIGGEAAGPATSLENLTPTQIVAELDRYIIGQNDAKRRS